MRTTELEPGSPQSEEFSTDLLTVLSEPTAVNGRVTPATTYWALKDNFTA